MALNHAEKLVLGLILNRFADLTKEDELADFVEARNPFGKGFHDSNGERIEAVSVQRLYQMYPNYSLTKKLIEFGQMVMNYVYEPVVFMPTMSRGVYSSHDEKFGLKMSLLEQNGLKFAHFDENIFRNHHHEAQREQMQRELATAFAVKINDYYVDFNLYLPEPEIKGIGEGVYGQATYLRIQEHIGDQGGRPTHLTREEKIEGYERQVIKQFTDWATNQALSFIRHSRHLRRQNKSLKDLVIQVEVTSCYVPEPEQKQAPQEPNAQTAHAPEPTK